MKSSGFAQHALRVPEDERPWFKHWPVGVPRHLDYPRKPLPHLLEETARRLPAKTAFLSGSESISFSRLDEESTAMAGGLGALGVRSGDRVLLLLPNCIEFVTSFYAALKAGAAAATLHPLVKESELSRAIEETLPKAAVVLSQLGQAERALLEASRVPVVEVGLPSGRKSTGFLEILSKRLKPAAPPLSFHDPAVIQYTGATTGAPKPAVMSHFNLLANAIQNATWFGWTEKDVVMGVLPLCHTWGSSCCMNSPIYSGATTVLVDRFEPDILLRQVEEVHATVLYGSATMFALLLDSPAMENSDISSLRWAKAGAMPVPRELKRKWDGKTGIELMLGYGLTEASPETHDSPPGKVREGTIGIPIVDTDARVVDMETGLDLGTDEPGELLIKGPQVTTLGYLDDREETERALRGGWLHTGDVAAMDSDGYFRLVDRKKDIIKCKGHTIYPVELEDVLYTHPAVKECAVVGKKHALFGEIPKAYVVSRENAVVSEKEILDFCERMISPHKRIREVEFVRDLPKTRVGKILRRKLRETT